MKPNTVLAEAAKRDLILAYIKNKEPINEKLIALAKRGNMAAIRELHERAYGKSTQGLELSGQITEKKIIVIDD